MVKYLTEIVTDTVLPAEFPWEILLMFVLCLPFLFKINTYRRKSGLYLEFSLGSASVVSFILITNHIDQRTSFQAFTSILNPLETIKCH